MTEEDGGKQAVTSGGDEIDVVVEVQDSKAHVEPDSGIPTVSRPSPGEATPTGTPTSSRTTTSTK